MPHHRSLSPPAQRDGRRPVIHRELQRHYDELYDQLLNGRPPRAARPLLDVGTGDGLALSAIVQGTPLSSGGGFGVDAEAPGDWLGPLEWAVVQADAHRLPFADDAFRSALLVDVFEWLRHPSGALWEVSRVTEGPILLVQTDWEGLWFQADAGRRVEAGRELLRLFTKGAPPHLRRSIRTAAADAGLALQDLRVASISSNRLEQGSLAWDLLEGVRRYLVLESAQVRARRFDEWRAELQREAAGGQFNLLLRRVVALLERADSSS